ncbi:hypothetical protein [Hoeflea sp.]|uniref:hypothetical protein n=1 Tax=Hoeflea sp. TaxID=1940281 RepID=UPI0019CBF471|nr:hypothetical protein [Hoeflea sp.]MBC7284945.1 DUF5132 domain-containing protein [Hoeflea sp.]
MSALASSAEMVDHQGHFHDSPLRGPFDTVARQVSQHEKKQMDRKFLFGASLAVGAVLLVPGVAAAVGRAARTIARAAFKTGTVAYTEFRRAGAEVYEHMEDLAAELQAGMQRANAGDEPTAEAESANGAAHVKQGERG